MNRKKFIAGLVALGAAPAAMGSLLDILPAHAADAPSSTDNKDLRYTANEITDAGANFFGITTEAMAKGGAAYVRRPGRTRCLYQGR